MDRLRLVVHRDFPRGQRRIDALQPYRGWQIFGGILLAIAGVIVILAAFGSIFALAVFAGIWLIVIGIGGIIEAFMARKHGAELLGLR
jgi:uncharacterized membrane protein HdeD (DUF308 family)